MVQFCRDKFCHRQKSPFMNRWTVAALTALLWMPAGAVPVITNVPAWNGSSAVGFYGPPVVQSVGQIFSATGLETQLENFTFFVQSSGQMTFQAYVQEFNQGTSTPVGNILFTSGAISNVGAGAFDAVTVNVGGLLLTAGSTYLAYFSTAQQSQVQPNASFGFVPGGSNANLGAPFQNNGGASCNAVTGPPSGSWANVGRELAFTANFSAGAVGGAPELDAGTACLPLCLSVILLLLNQVQRRGVLNGAGVDVGVALLDGGESQVGLGGGDGLQVAEDQDSAARVLLG